ncbi:MAG TPA: TIR domain-containing protein [Sphingomicrobium sp.]|jgi:tetratricopeptide (TPR) repeat protein|nr:TIR domain-containing protein [Sphingomicrobium sp.]
MAKVFLSYVRADVAVARNIAAALEGSGHDVWWDRHIRGGSQFSKEIEEALEAAEVVVVLWSRKSIESAWVRDEAGVGRDSGRLLPVRIDNCNPPLGFRQYQTVDLLEAGKSADCSAFEELNEELAAMTQPGSEARRRRLASGAKESKLTRRGLLIGAGAGTALAAGGGGVFLYRRTKAAEAPREVQPLMLQAKQLMNQNTRDGQYQAIGLYQRVVETAPNYADGWGWLGYTYGVVSHFRERAESLALKARAEAAGRHALELDPDSAMGEVALSVALPFIGHWAERERRLLRAQSLDPNNDEIFVMLAVALQFAGRSSEAVPQYLRIKHKPLTPAEYTNFLSALWSAGRLPELDQAISDAASLYPTQGTIWFTRLAIATYGGQAGAVAALVEDVPSRPSDVSDEVADELLRLARAVQSRDPAEADSIMADQLAGARYSANQAELSIRNASALGRLDDAFIIADAYYFGRGFVIPDVSAKGSDFSPEQRGTRFLFEPETKPMRADPRFEPLVKELGFDRYWRESGKPPDYRHIPGL